MELSTLLAWKGEILTVVFGVWGAWLTTRSIRVQRNSVPRKAFAAGTVSRVIFVPGTELTEEFETRFRGDVVTRLTELRVFFMNTGNVEITAEDFTVAPSVIMPGTEKFYDCKVMAQRPADLPAKVIQGSESISLEPLLLNPGDFVAVRAIRSGKPTTRRLGGRIKGVSQIDLLLPGQYANWFTYYPLTMAVGGAVMLYIAFATYTHSTGSRAAFALAPLAFAAIFWGSAIVHRVRFRTLRTASYMGRGTEHLEFEPLVKE